MLIGALLMTLTTTRAPRRTLLVALMGIVTTGNLLSALAGSYTTLLLARIVTSLIMAPSSASARWWRVRPHVADSQADAVQHQRGGDETCRRARGVTQDRGDVGERGEHRAQSQHRERQHMGPRPRSRSSAIMPATLAIIDQLAAGTGIRGVRERAGRPGRASGIGRPDGPASG